MEVSFRLSLLVAQLVSILEKAGETYKKAKRSYADRSRIAHGNAAKVGHAEWNTAWTLLVACLRAVLFRMKLPSEGELITELFMKPENLSIH